MHMADALISPSVGGVGYIVGAAAVGYSIYKINMESDDSKIPLMGVLGAFVFAAQMINFTIPGTGSSGHICGSLLLAVLLGPYAAMVVITSVLLTQSLFFADGGLVALGCNIINMGLFSCFVAYPLIYKTIAGSGVNKKRLWLACVCASIIGLLIGAGGVVVETTLSGVSELPFKKFLILMLTIHLPIGLIEGMITASVLVLVRQTRPDLLTNVIPETNIHKYSLKKIYILFAVMAFFTGGVISWFASSHPDGLEWSISKTTGKEELENSDSFIVEAGCIQRKTAFMPDYSFSSVSNDASELAGTSFSGIIGAVITLLIAGGVGGIMRSLRTKRLIQKNG